VLAVFVLAGTRYRLFYLYMNMSGYEQWLYVAFGVWGLDRLFRVLCVLKNGIQRARITDNGGNIMRLDIEGIRWGFQSGKIVYAFFPTLQPLRPWENHPFSVLPTGMLERCNSADPAPSRESSLSLGSCTRNNAEKGVISQQIITKKVATTASNQPTAGITLFIRKSEGFTKQLTAGTNILALLDGPYPENPSTTILQCDRVLLICGGIGITAILPWIDSHPNVKLAWSVNGYASYLVESVSKVLDRVVEKEVRIGRRLDITELLAEDAQAGWRRIGVVTCGPEGMCYDTRVLVTEAAKRGDAQFELEVHAYGW
jgi:hypothetical protein